MKPRVPGWEIKKNTGRIDPVVDPNGGPGTHDENRNFGHDAKNFSIGVKREVRTENLPGPGQYSPERGDQQTKNSSPEPRFDRQTGRKSASIDHNGGPGTYYDEKRNTFGDRSNNMTIGTRKEV